MGAAVITGNCTESACRLKLSSIFTAVSRNTCNISSSEYNICHKRKEIRYIHRLKKLHTSASKANSKQRNSTKTEADHIASQRKSGKTVELCRIPGHEGVPGNFNADKKKATEASRRQEEMIASPYQNLFPYNNDSIYEKLNTAGNDNDDKLKEIKSDTRPRKENN